MTLGLTAFLLRADTIPWPLTALDLARQRVAGVHCVNNLKQTILAARLWSLDHHGQGPPTLTTLTNELASPAFLSCPANHNHPVATNWSTFDWRWNDYEWLPEADWYEPTAVACRCRIHDAVGRVDGTAHWPGGYRPGWPAILAGPLSQQVTPGTPVRFEVRLAPATQTPVHYQWRRHQLTYVTNITLVPDPDDPAGGSWRTNRQGVFSTLTLPGETNAIYIIADARPGHSDYYSVMASNAVGASTSSESSLSVDASVAFRATNQYWMAAHCINNLKQIALFARMWANDHDERFPPGLAAMTNSSGLPLFGWPTLLYCRYDQARSVPADWAGVDFANTSYEFLPVRFPAEDDPSAVLCRCRAHGFWARADGYVEHQPRFTVVRPRPNARTEMVLELFAGQSSVLESSSDLIHWSRLNSFTTQGTVSLTETNLGPQRFYRIRTE